MKKGTLTAIIVILLAAIIVLVCGIGSSWFTNGDIATWFNSWGKGTEQEQPADEEQGEETGEEQEQGGMLVEEGDSNGISLMSVKIAAADYDEYGISPMAESAQLLTATITPDTAADKAVDWSVSFVNPSSEWSKEHSVTDCVTVTPTSDGALTATVECLQAFGEQVKITVTSRANSSATAECTVDYQKRLDSFTWSAAYDGSNFDDSTNITWNFFGESDSTALTLPVYQFDTWGFHSFMTFEGNVIVPTWGVGTVDSELGNVYLYVNYDSGLKSAMASEGFTLGRDADDSGWSLVSSGSYDTLYFCGPESFFMDCYDSDGVKGAFSTVESGNKILSALREVGGVVGELKYVVEYGNGLTKEQTCSIGFAPASIGLVASSVSLSPSDGLIF